MISTKVMEKEFYEVTISDYKPLYGEGKMGARVRRFGQNEVETDGVKNETYTAIHNDQLSDETRKMLERFLGTRDISKKLEALALIKPRETGKDTTVRLEFA